MTLSDLTAVCRRVPDGARNVVVLRWPEDAAEVEALGRARVPRLLLLDPAAEPPRRWDPLTDWVRLPADELDVEVRLLALRARAPRPDGLRLAHSNLLWRGSERVALRPVEARMMAALLSRAGAVVPRAELVAAVWPAGGRRAARIGPHVRRLRRRVVHLGVHIRAVRRTGFRLETRS